MDWKRSAMLWVVPIALMLSTLTHENVEALPFDCGNATNLAVGDEVSGDTTGLSGSIDSYGCGNEPETGPEQIYRLELTEPTWFEVAIESDVDLDLILLSGCDSDQDCLAIGDVGIRGTRAAMGTFYLVVDGYAGAEGAYTLRVTRLDELQIPEELCPPFITKREFRSYEWDGTSCHYPNLVSGLLCSYSATGGQESPSEQFIVEAGGSFTAQVSESIGDLAVYLIAGCGDQSRCLAFADQAFEGGDETLNWTNQDVYAQEVYLFVDTVGDPEDCADYHIYIEGDLVFVPAEESSWSTLKSWFAGPGGPE